MTMSPPDAARDDGRMVRGILSRYTPVHGVQYYRDLAGNVRQVGARIDSCQDYM